MERPLLSEKKESYDGATPSGNSVCASNFLRLSRLTGQTRFEEKANAIIVAFSEEVGRYHAGHNMLLMALDFGLGPTHEVVVTGPSESTKVKTFLSTLSFQFSPRRVLLFRPSDREDLITNLAPFTADLKPIDDKPAIYVCHDFACERPTTDLSEALSRC